MINWIDRELGVTDIEISKFESRRHLEIDLVLDVRYYFTQVYKFDIAGTMPKESLINVIDLVVEKAREGRKILLHCYGGIDRAPFAAVVYLVKRYGMDVSEAYTYVMEKRPQAMYHPEWEGWLRDFLGTSWGEYHNKPP